MKHYWTNKKCVVCNNDFIDKSHAQRAKKCSRKCETILYKERISKYSKAYKSKPEIKEREKYNNKIWYAANKEKANSYGLLWSKNNRHLKNATQAKRRAAKRNATPKWLDDNHLKQIELYYMVAKWVEGILKEKVHVDHIVPLQGDNVSGLHVPWNLQLLTEAHNLSKSNKT